ncbi:MAG: DUF5063 domain-containing protein [Labilithrix sp.]|nr:DUF5063 domain-containing protein [Labilithrix sp.]
MDRPAFSVRLRLLSAGEGGRHSPIRSNYRPTFDIANTLGGQPMLNDGRLMLAVEELAPGAECLATLEPLRPEYWDGVRVGTAVPITEGTRIVGYATVTERVWPAAFTPATATFVRAAYDLCQFVTKAGALALRERLHRARAVLLPLYAAATELPRSETGTESVAPSFPVPETWPGFAEHDDYWEVFNPYEHAKPVAGWLSDDVLDVYRDVRSGLWFWEKNAIADAVWEWRFSFESHWGDHAIDALRALHRACGRAVPENSGSAPFR